MPTNPFARLAYTLMIAGGLFGVTTAAQAHPKVVRADPAADAALVASPKAITIEFNETLMGRFSNFKLATTAGAAVPVTTRADGKSLTGALATPLRAGAYRVSWRAAGADGHPMQGSYDFRVR